MNIHELEIKLDQIKRNLGSIHKIYGELPTSALKHFAAISQTVNPKNILEIGFNRGASTAAWLLTSSANVLSIDLRTESVGSKYLTKHFKPRFRYLCLNSLYIPIMQEFWKGYFDLAFIDGHHIYPSVERDTTNCINLNIPFIVFDDYYHPHPVIRNNIQTIIQKENRLEIVETFPAESGGHQSGGQCLTKVLKE